MHEFAAAGALAVLITVSPAQLPAFPIGPSCRIAVTRGFAVMP